MKRLATALAVLVVLAAVALAQTPPPGGPPPGRGPGGRGGFAPPPFPDSTAAERDSLMNEVIKSIAGKEQMAAESVFKDIKSLKGRRAADVPRIMNYGFGRSLGASCYFCHAKDDWSKSDKKTKQVARGMMAMSLSLNEELLPKVDGLIDLLNEGAPAGGGPGGPGGPGGQRKPVVNCSTCHRGSIHTNPDFGRMGGGPRPAGAPGGPGGGGGR